MKEENENENEKNTQRRRKPAGGRCNGYIIKKFRKRLRAVSTKTRRKYCLSTKRADAKSKKSHTHRTCVATSTLYILLDMYIPFIPPRIIIIIVPNIIYIYIYVLLYCWVGRG